MKRVINPVIFFIVLIFLFLSISLLTDDPFVWPDEAIYGDISRNLMLENRMGTDLWAGLINGIENHAYSLPPLFLYVSALWYKFFGFSITTQRLFSVFLGALNIILFYKLSEKLLPAKSKLVKRYLHLLVLMLLTIDAVFLKTSRLGRPEVMVLSLELSSLLFYLQSFLSKRPNKYLFLTGLFLGLSIITHLIAGGFALAVIVTLIYSQRKNIFDFRKYYFFGLGLLIPLVLWMVYLYPNYQYLYDQLKLVEQSRHYTIPWYMNVWNFPLLHKLNYLFYLLISLSFVVFTLKNRKLSYILLSLVLIFSWIFTTLGQIYWYVAYPIIFSYLALLILVSHVFALKGKGNYKTLARISLSLICLFLLYSNLMNYRNLINSYQNADAYPIFQEQILKAVPPGKVVFLSSIPDAYYAFPAGRNQLLEFPALFEGMDQLKKVLNEADYLVFNGGFIPNPEASVYFDHYIGKNHESIQEINDPYNILIVKLKDKNLRLDAN